MRRRRRFVRVVARAERVRRRDDVAVRCAVEGGRIWCRRYLLRLVRDRGEGRPDVVGALDEVARRTKRCRPRENATRLSPGSLAVRFCGAGRRRQARMHGAVHVEAAASDRYAGQRGDGVDRPDQSSPSARAIELADSKAGAAAAPPIRAAWPSTSRWPLVGVAERRG